MKEDEFTEGMEIGNNNYDDNKDLKFNQFVLPLGKIIQNKRLDSYLSKSISSSEGENTTKH